jgi:hypothetical protein
MSKIVIFAAKVKRLLSSNKDYFTDAINYEYKVVDFLTKKLNEEKTRY